LRHVSTPPAIIYLGRRLLDASCDLPEAWDEQPLSRLPETPHAWSCSRWGLPGRPGHPGRRWSLTPPFHPRWRCRAGALHRL